MSHFTVLVTNTAEDELESQLSPFDEDRRMPMHIVETKADFIARGRKEVEHAQKKIAEYDADPVAYEADCNNPRHIEWLKGEAREVAKTTDEDELFKIGAEWYLEDEEESLDADGNRWGISNEDAKWDWWTIGGRWAGFFQAKTGADYKQGHHRAKDFAAITGEEVEDLTESAADVIKVKDIDWDAMDRVEREQRAKYWDEQMAEENPDRRFIWSDNREEILKMSRDEYINRPISHSTFAVLHKGRWYERGEMGWWVVVSNEKAEAEWDQEWRKLIESLDPETQVTVVDCHI